MAPRLINPHSLPDDAVVVSRAQIYDVENEAEKSDEETRSTNASLIRKLDEFLQSQFGSNDEIASSTPERKKKKRQKVESSAQSDHDTELIPFCLLSRTRSVHTISLLPKPPPELNIRVREPPCEDTEAEAQERSLQAEAVAIDASQIRSESLLRTPLLSNPRKLCSVTSKNPPNHHNSPLIVLSLPQTFRTTRPPISLSELEHWPYSRGTPASPGRDRSIPTFEALPSKTRAISSRSRRRRRSVKGKKDRPQPTFWRPDPAWRGKCMGYAMGY